jgi:hypothetical protein
MAKSLPEQLGGDDAPAREAGTQLAAHELSEMRVPVGAEGGGPVAGMSAQKQQAADKAK